MNLAEPVPLWRVGGVWPLGDIENNVLAIVKQRSEALAKR